MQQFLNISRQLTQKCYQSIAKVLKAWSEKTMEQFQAKTVGSIFYIFFKVPVQRVTKYPLLLGRLYKVTPHRLEGREAIREAQKKIEAHLEHINSVRHNIFPNIPKVTMNQLNSRESLSKLPSRKSNELTVLNSPKFLRYKQTFLETYMSFTY